MSINYFKEASARKLRFTTPKGELTVEDLWDLPLTASLASLDDLAISLNEALSNTAESFVVKAKKEDRKTRIKFEVVKQVIADRVEALARADRRVANKAKRDQIAALLADKENASLANKSAKALRELLESIKDEDEE